MHMTDSSSFGLKEAFDVYSKHRDVIVQLWSFYSAGTLAVLGYTVGSEKATRSWPEVGAILIGYLAFTAGNAWAVVSSQRELCSMARGIAALLEDKPVLKPYYAVSPLHPDKFIFFFVAVTTLVCAAILAKYAFKVAHARKPRGA
jgi:hypothetical protein